MQSTLSNVANHRRLFVQANGWSGEAGMSIPHTAFPNQQSSCYTAFRKELI